MTPETDKAERMAFANEYMVPTEVARRLERERDEAIAECKALWNLVNANKQRAYKAERERDEAREAIIGLENKWKCAVDMAARAELERDEAIAARKASAADWLGQIEQANLRVSRALQQVALAERQRDEAWSCCDELVVDSNAVTLAKTVMALEKERGAPREDLKTSQAVIRNLRARIGKDSVEIEQLTRERDEARELADQWRQESNWIGNEPTYKFPWEAAK